MTPCFIDSHEAVHNERAWVSFNLQSTPVKGWDLEVLSIFIRQENLSCSNCYFNWFCLTELDLQHFRDVNFSLWLWCIQVWRAITASCFVHFVALPHILRAFEGADTTKRNILFKINQSETINFQDRILRKSVTWLDLLLFHLGQ